MANTINPLRTVQDAARLGGLCAAGGTISFVASGGSLEAAGNGCIAGVVILGVASDLWDGDRQLPDTSNDPPRDTRPADVRASEWAASAGYNAEAAALFGKEAKAREDKTAPPLSAAEASLLSGYRKSKDPKAAHLFSEMATRELNPFEKAYLMDPVVELLQDKDEAGTLTPQERTQYLNLLTSGQYGYRTMRSTVSITSPNYQDEMKAALAQHRAWEATVPAAMEKLILTPAR